jgi:hypothetical protein
MRLLEKTRTPDDGAQYELLSSTVWTVFMHGMNDEVRNLFAKNQENVQLGLVDSHCSTYSDRIALISDEGEIVGHFSDQRAYKVRELLRHYKENDIVLAISMVEGFTLKPGAITYPVNVEGYIASSAGFKKAEKEAIEELLTKSSKKSKRN